MTTKTLLSIKDIATMFGKAERTVRDRWTKSPGFPKPRYAPTRNTRLWAAPDVERWATRDVRQ